MNILYFSPILFSDLKQRPQHLAEELAKYHKVFYIEPSVSFIKCIVEKSDLYKFRKFDINKNLTVIRPSGKYRFPKSIEVIDLLSINNFLEKRQIKDILKDSDIIWLGNPIYYSIIKGIKNKKVIYDKMDDYINLTDGKMLKKVVEKNEKKLIEKANIIFTTSQLFYEDLKSKREAVYLAKNGVDISFASINRCSYNDEIVEYIDKLKNDGKTVFGYVGTIGNWFDYQAITNIINYNKNFHILIIGLNKLSELDNNNIHYFGPVEKNRLPVIVNKFDYCLYPFKINKILDTIDPVKIYEYLSLNKKVIAVKSLETARFSKFVPLYRNYEELNYILNHIEEISLPFINEEERKKFIQNNTWGNRTIEILRRVLI